MALQGNALKEYNAQFQRSMASPEALSDKKKPVVIDGAAVLDKYVGGESAAAMTGAEFYALVGHIKRQHGQRGEAQEHGADVGCVGIGRLDELHELDAVRLLDAASSIFWCLHALQSALAG